ncbi:hypothetical protein [Andreprevotia chitinilytica]|uniref:hypothetical protein n=1 Tax=Andreprevotia chitinilytica TaxID=396808 RepID=UPI000554A28D|nr:hypothetical protein [Andreprevotia chitinilytica]
MLKVVSVAVATVFAATSLFAMGDNAMGGGDKAPNPDAPPAKTHMKKAKMHKMHKPMASSPVTQKAPENPDKK